jgi:hypothetical protein
LPIEPGPYFHDYDFATIKFMQQRNRSGSLEPRSPADRNSNEKSQQQRTERRFARDVAQNAERHSGPPARLDRTFGSANSIFQCRRHFRHC